MAYIGKEPAVGNFQVCDAISVVNGQAAYTLQVSSTNEVPESANHMLVSLNGILQKPNSSFTVSGSTITFASNLATGDVIDFIMLLGNVLDIGTPSDSTVTNAKTNFVTTSSAAGLQIKGDGSTAGALQLNCEQNSHGILLQSPPHSANQSYTLKFPSGNVTAGKFLKVDSVSGSGTTGVGTMTFADAGGDNTPAFMATRSGGDQTIPNTTYTLMSFNNEIIDTDSAYDNSAYTFTVPSGKNGTYLIGGQVAKNSSGSTDRLIMRITKTTGGSESSFLFGEAYSKDYAKATSSKICTLAVGDILKMYAYQNTGGDVPIEQGEENSFFFAIKLG